LHAEPAGAESDVTALSGLPIKALLIAAMIPTVVAYMLGVQSQLTVALLPIALATNLTTILLPTLMLYFILMLAAWLAFTRRSLASAAVLALSLLPFLHWGHAHWTTSRQHQQEADEIAAIPTTPAASWPSTIVFESRSVTGMRAAWKVSGIERVIAKGAYSQRLVQFERAQGRRPAAQESVISSLPAEYLLLKVGRMSSFAAKGQIYATAGGPFELRLVKADRDELIAVWYRKFNPGPSILPLLATQGWFRGSNSATTDQVSDVITAFLTKALASPG
jgi:hypothetical protein